MKSTIDGFEHTQTKTIDSLTELTSGNSNRKVFNYERSSKLAILIFLFFYLIITYIHLDANTVPPRWDDSWYLTNSEIVFKALQGNDTYSSMYYGVRNVNGFYLPFLFSRLMDGVRAPLIALLPIPSYFIFGTGFPGLTATYFFLIIFFCLIFYKLVSELTHDGWTAFLAVVITSTMPLTIGLSRYFVVEYSLMILGISWVYFQIRSDNFRDRQYSVPLGIVLGLGMLMKITFPVYIIGSIIGGLISFARNRNFNRQQGINLLLNSLIILMIGILLMSGWYINNFKQVISNAFNAGFGSASQDYSLGNVFDIGTLLEYWTRVINVGVSFYYFVILFLFSMIEGAKYVFRRRQPVGDITNPEKTTTQLIVLWFLAPFLIFSFGVNKDYRFLLPALPALGFIIAQLIMKVSNKNIIRIITVPLLLVFPCFLFGFTSLPLSSTYTLSTNTFLIIAPDIGYDTRPVTQVWHQQKILMIIKEDAEKNNIKIDFPVGIIPNHIYFNSLNFMYLSIHQDLSYQFESFWPAEDEEAWSAQKKRLLMMDYLVTKTGDQGPIFAYNPDITPLLLMGELPFAEVTRLNLPDGSEAVIYRKINQVEH